VIVGAGVWFKFASDDKTHEGAKLALAAGVALAVAGIVDLVYLRFGEIDQMFLQTRSGQVAARWVMVAVGVGTCIAATVAYAR
jgi:hypothetical protein